MPPTANPQQVHNITTSRTTLRQDIQQAVQQIHNKSTTLRQVVQQAVQQIHNKSNKWSLSFSQRQITA